MVRGHVASFAVGLAVWAVLVAGCGGGGGASTTPDVAVADSGPGAPDLAEDAALPADLAGDDVPVPADVPAPADVPVDVPLLADGAGPDLVGSDAADPDLSYPDLAGPDAAGEDVPGEDVPGPDVVVCTVGTPCSDGDPCTQADTCTEDGACVGTMVNCADGDACNGHETCVDGACAAGAPLVCDDGVATTRDTCEPATGCVFTPWSGPCDDGNPCTVGDLLDEGACLAGATFDCGGDVLCDLGCDGDVRSLCVGDVPVAWDCAADGATCGAGADGASACLCGADTEAHCVDADTLASCDEGLLTRRSCADVGARCGRNDAGDAGCACDPARFAASCADSFVLATCGVDGLVTDEDCRDYGGACTNDGVAARCSCAPGSLTASCADDATLRFCGADAAVTAIACAEVGGGGCTDGAGGGEGCACGAAFAPTCLDDALLLTCGAGGVTTVADCRADGETCGLGSDGRAACVGPGCPGVPASGLCEGTILRTCADGYPGEDDCAARGQVCGFDPATGANGCIDAGCGPYTATGECVGEQAVWCQDGALQLLDCAAYGATCGIHPEAGAWCQCDPQAFPSACYGDAQRLFCHETGWMTSENCGDISGTCGVGDDGGFACVGTGCDGESYLGRCDGGAIVWCQDRLVRSIDCAANDYTCGYDSGRNIYNCMEAAATCGDVPVEGRCEGSLLEFCDGGVPLAVDCAETDRRCDVSDVYGVSTCLGCAGIPEGNLCSGATLYYCADEVVGTFDCGAVAMACGDTGQGFSYCTCDPAAYEAYCAGDTVVSCDASLGMFDSLDCAPLGGTCGTGAAGNATCVGGGCGAETFEGRCAGDTLVFCTDGLVREVDCGAYGYACGYDAGVAGYNCVAGSSGGCGAETSAGRCDGDTLVICDATAGVDQVVTVDCAGLQMVCGEVTPGAFGCMDPPGCGDVSVEGRCEGDTLLYCADERLYRVECPLLDQRCVADELGYASCVDAAGAGCGAETFVGRCAGDTLVYCGGDEVVTIDCAAGDLACGSDGELGMNCVPPATLGACDPACGAGEVCVAGMCRSDGTQAREWTFLVYVAGDNDLWGAAIGDLDEMEQVGSTADVAIAVQVELSTDSGLTAPYTGDTFRALVRQHPEWMPDLDSLVRGAIGDQNMGDPATLASFIQWGVETYPARHYALVLWNHGGGFTGGFQDVTANDSLTLAEIRRGIRDGGRFLDVVDFDACLMGMYEVAAELYDVAGYVAASEEVEPGCGDPYHTMLGHLVADPAMGPAALASTIVDDYAAFYRSEAPEGCRADVTKSALDLSKALELHGLVTALANGLRADLRTARPAILAAVSAAQGFYYPFYRDLADLAARLASAPTLSDTTREAAEALRDHIVSGEGIVIRNAVVQRDSSTALANARGVSIFAPDLAQAAEYGSFVTRYEEELTFRQRQSAWSRFVEELTVGAVPEGATLVPVQGGTTVRWFANAAATIASRADLSLWVLEPDGHLYSPAYGVTTPNGSLTAESSSVGASEEAYSFNAEVAAGPYYFFVIYERDGVESTSAWVRATIELAGAEGSPFEMARLDREGRELPMSLDSALADPVGQLVNGELDDAELEGMWSNAYSNVWMLPVVSL